MMRLIITITLGILLVLVIVPCTAEDIPENPELWLPNNEVFSYREPSEAKNPAQANTMIGKSSHHRVEKDETLLDIARRYHLGYQEMVHANPGVDPWVPIVGEEINIPSIWILPRQRSQGVVLNIPEMRLYYYLPDSKVMTFPLGVGMEGWKTPPGKFWIGEKRKNPVWYVPASIQEEMEEPRKLIPPGPDNPLGSYWMRLSATAYGIHGTNNPWAVGRYVTHGCIRLYPEDIAFLYPRVPPKTPVEIIYQRTKIGLKAGKAYFQIYRHPDTEDTVLLSELIQQVRELELVVDLRAMRELLRTARNGALLPVPIKSNDNN